MIRAIITDVDGVIVGRTSGVNFPIPQTEVLGRLQSLRESGMPVVLCSAKSLHPILPIIEKAKLDNRHIVDGGAVIVDPLEDKITTHPIPKEIVEKIVYFALENNIYTEVYALDKYFFQKDQECSYTSTHAKVMLQEPIGVSSLLEIIEKEEVIKLVLFVPTPDDKGLLNPFLEGLEKEISHIWTMHPTLLPAQAAVITAHGVSKKHGAEEIVKQLGISFDEVLGIGDTLGDWSFMQLCGYVAVIGDESEELKEKAREKGEEKCFLAPSVEENGILKALDYFLR